MKIQSPLDRCSFLFLAPLALAGAAGAGELLDVTLSVYDDLPPGSTPFEVHYYAGAAWGDVDGDGYPDLFVTDYFGPNRLYLNVPAAPGAPGPKRTLAFAPEAIDPDPAGMGEGAVFADFDNDGDADLYLVNQGGTPNHLYENVGGTYVEASAGSGVDDPDFGEGCSVADFDGDGLLDLFLTNYGDPSDPLNPGAPNHLFKNVGGLSFVDVTADVGIPMLPARSSACVWADYDLDGDADLFVGNEGAPNQLLENLGGTFADVTGSVGGAALADAAGGTFGARWVDADGDGDFDLYVSDGMTDVAPDATNKLYVNELLPSGEKTLVSVPFGAASPDYGMSLSVGDLDLDGSLDIALANFVPNEIFFGLPGGPDFAPAPPAYYPEPFSDFTSSATTADFDKDGDLDVVFGGSSGVFFYENVPDPGRASTVVRFAGDDSDPYSVATDGHGTRAFPILKKSPPFAFAEPGPLQQIDGGSGYAQDAPEIVIGHAAAGESVSELHVTWANGTKEIAFGLPTLAPGAKRVEIELEYPAGIAVYGTQSDPDPLTLWRHGVGSTFPAASLGETEFALASTGSAPGSITVLGVGLTAVSIPLLGGDLLMLPAVVVPGIDMGGFVQWAFPLPTSPSLEGTTVFCQAVEITLAGEFDWSNGLALTWQP